MFRRRCRIGNRALIQADRRKEISNERSRIFVLRVRASDSIALAEDTGVVCEERVIIKAVGSNLAITHDAGRKRVLKVAAKPQVVSVVHERAVERFEILALATEIYDENGLVAGRSNAVAQTRQTLWTIVNKLKRFR